MHEPRQPVSPRAAAGEIVRRLRQAGHVAYFAGGCVRDGLLGRAPKDYDVATDARPARVRRLFRRSQYVGQAFGVCLVHVGEQAIEVATFRTEWGYEDGRRPEHVSFTDARHDARRRDFTINGLFAEPAEAIGTDRDRIIDYVGGRADLEAGRVRAIGEPRDRFDEDYLRMLRAVRFAAGLGFSLEPRTAAAIRAAADRLTRISRERIGQEVAGMLTSNGEGGIEGEATDAPRRATGRAEAVRLMNELRLDGPVLNATHHHHAAATLAHLDADARLGTALAAWMLDRYVRPIQAAASENPHALARDKPSDLAAVFHFVNNEASDRLKQWRKALNLSNDVRDHLRHTLTLAAQAHHWPAMTVAQRKRLLAHSHWPDTLQLLRALRPGEPLRIIERDAPPLFTQGVAPPPLLTGDDLISLGLPPGPSFGQLLEQVYDAQLEGRLCTREQARDWVKRESRADD